MCVSMQITKKPPAKGGKANGAALPAAAQSPPNGSPVDGGDGTNGDFKPPPGVRTLLEFVAWVVHTHQVDLHP